jgi:hypothetical protein
LFEISLSNAHDYANPFADVTLEATFISPAGRKIRASGFYDGGKTWRLRFMPEEVGKWRYEARFSDGSPGASGAFRCVKGSLRGPLRVNPANRLWFQYSNGAPMYMLAFHLWKPDALDEPILAKTLDSLKGLGFNTIVGPHLIPPDRLPWGKKADGKPDFSRLNLDEWRRLDKMIRMLADREMVLIPFSIFGGTNGMPKIPTVEQEDLFLRYWTARWGGYWNITYQPTSEWAEDFKTEEILRIGSKLHELDGGRHLVSVHDQDRNNEALQRASWYDYHTIQDKLTKWDPEKYTWLADLYQRIPKPILAHECVWEGDTYQKEAGMDVDNLRKGAWFIAISGGQINFDDDVRPGRKYRIGGGVPRQDVSYSEVGSAITPGGRAYGAMKVLAGFIRSLPFERMTVAPKLSSTGVCLAEDGKHYITYTKNGGKITLDLARGKGSFIGRWFNPRDGKYGRPFEIKAGKPVELSAPDDNDWVLRVER